MAEHKSKKKKTALSRLKIKAIFFIYVRNFQAQNFLMNLLLQNRKCYKNTTVINISNSDNHNITYIKTQNCQIMTTIACRMCVP